MLRPAPVALGRPDGARAYRRARYTQNIATLDDVAAILVEKGLDKRPAGK